MDVAAEDDVVTEAPLLEAGEDVTAPPPNAVRGRICPKSGVRGYTASPTGVDGFETVTDVTGLEEAAAGVRG